MNQDSIIQKNLGVFDEGFLESFEQMPEDKYLKSEFSYRKRRYGTGVIINGIFIWNSQQESFLQSEKINNYTGGITREFAPILESSRQDIEKIVYTAYSALPQTHYSVGIHQLRIVADHFHQGMPTPEGIHQDGFDYVTVSCIGVSNVSGGISLLVDANDYNKVLFEGMLYPGTMLAFSDRKFAHYTSNISPKLPGEAYRDVVVTTFKIIDKSEVS